MLRDIRSNYQKHKLDEESLPQNPLELFNLWLNEAIHEQINEPTAMVLATSANGVPDTRVVLLKEIEEGNFLFYTNYNSAKAQQMFTNPLVALNFFWPELERQVRVKGKISKVTDDLSNDYFKTRPRDSQLGAWASAQSKEIKDREELEKKFHDTMNEYKNLEIPKPTHWGGYQVKPNEIEFWQGRPSRLHDRIRYYRIIEGKWEFKRLSP